MANILTIEELREFEKSQKQEYYEYIITSNDELTVTSFLSSNKSLVSGISRLQFLDFDGGTGKSNLERIYDSYTWDGQKQLNKTSYSAKSLETINKGTILLIPKNKVKEELVQINGKNLYLEQNENQKAYYSSKLIELQNDPYYIKKNNVQFSGRELDVQMVEENCQVWVYSKALNKIINLSPFIVTLNTSKNDVGSFNISLNPILGEKRSLSSSLKNKINYFDINQGIDYFSKYLQYNDIVFIRFEKLELEKDNEELYDFEISKSKLPNQIFDMIGLIDSVSSNINSKITDFQINISGRDLMKLLVEDGNYFLPFRFASGSGYQFFYSDPNSKQGKRNFYNGAYDFIFTYSFRSIKETFAFIMNFLSNLGVIGDEDLFSAYGDRRTQAYIEEISTSDKNYLRSQEVNGIWQIIKLSTSELIDDRRIADPSIGNVDSTLIEQMNKVCQKPFVEFWGDTYGSQFEFIVRQPPWDKKGILDSIKNEIVIDIEDKDLQSFNLEWETEFYSWFQIHPNNIFAGDNKWAFATYLPIVFLDEFAQYFGNHRKIIQDIYISEQALSGIDGGKNLDLFKESVLNDLKYLIDSHVYLPFSRRGQIVLTSGDRRIKKGMWVRLKKTGELCYVDSVNNSVSFGNSSVDRFTSLQVSRCLVEKYIKGVTDLNSSELLNVNYENRELTVTKKVFSYFNIVNTELIKNTLIQKVNNPILDNSVEFIKPKNQLSTNFGVNKEVFEFFLKRLQF